MIKQVRLNNLVIKKCDDVVVRRAKLSKMMTELFLQQKQLEAMMQYAKHDTSLSVKDLQAMYKDYKQKHKDLTKRIESLNIRFQYPKYEFILLPEAPKKKKRKTTTKKKKTTATA